ncbi:MAG: purine-nucleoside phosphorylase [Spirochaetes bacterium]|nr:purine-nucleoside phosphorylase [Spirochaetota bacterium]
MFSRAEETAAYILSQTKFRPETSIILGSGLGDLAEYITEKEFIEYEKIPHFPVSTVSGHAGRLVFGKLKGVAVMAMQGRFHFYEGYSMQEVAYPVFVMKLTGIKKLIVSNAAGGINREFSPGTLMIIEDHINLFGTNPLIGRNDDRFGKRFPDMTEAYKKYLINIAAKCASELGIDYKKGVYAGLTGPCYESAAEIRYLETIGADAVGMSTVPEVIAANYLGLDVLGISCITNMATGISVTAHDHASVVSTAGSVSEKFCSWVSEIVSVI